MDVYKLNNINCLVRMCPLKSTSILPRLLEKS